jgi:hypothetical protein
MYICSRGIGVLKCIHVPALERERSCIFVVGERSCIFVVGKRSCIFVVGERSCIFLVGVSVY